MPVDSWTDRQKGKINVACVRAYKVYNKVPTVQGRCLHVLRIYSNVRSWTKTHSQEVTYCRLKLKGTALITNETALELHFFSKALCPLPTEPIKVLGF